jgi:hypothetical protein
MSRRWAILTPGGQWERSGKRVCANGTAFRGKHAARPSADGQGKETEHNWLPREKSLIRIRGLLRGQAHVKHLDSFLAGMKMGIAEGISKTVSGYMGQD